MTYSGEGLRKCLTEIKPTGPEEMHAKKEKVGNIVSKGS